MEILSVYSTLTILRLIELTKIFFEEMNILTFLYLMPTRTLHFLDDAGCVAEIKLRAKMKARSGIVKHN